MKSFGLTDRGLVREGNEDHFFRSDQQIGSLKNLYIVADGMGGHKAGAIASRQAVAYLIKYIEENNESDVSVLLSDAVLYANEQVYKESQRDNRYQGMGTTLVACTIDNKKLHVVNVGDSRLYLMNQSLNQVTIDHSIVEELYRSGHITSDEKRVHPDRNIITRAIGVEGNVAVDYFSKSIDMNSMIVLCSDGLNKMIEDDAIELLLKRDMNLESLANKLVEGAKDLGGNDNITVLLIKLGNEVLS